MTSTQTTSNDDLDAVTLFRKASFVKDSAYGEVRFLKAGEKLDDMGPMHIADWFAQEADGAVIGRLRLEGIRPELCPIVVIDNEGSVHLTGFSLVDHFGSYTDAASANELDALLAWCRKHGLAGPRSSKTIAEVAKRLKLTSDKIERGKLPKLSETVLRELRAAAPTVATPAKAKPIAAGTPSSPQADSVGWAIGPDGAPWVVVPPVKDTKTCKSALHRWTGKGFVQAGEIRGWTCMLVRHGGQLAFSVTAAIGLHDGTKETAKFATDEDCDALLATDERLVIYSARAKSLFALKGGAFVAVPGAIDADAKVAMIDDHRVVAISESKTVVVDLNTGKTAKWPKPPIDMVGPIVVAGGHLLIAGYGEINSLALDTGKWAKPKSVANALTSLAALDDGDVVGFYNVSLASPPKTRVVRINTKKLSSKPVGELHFGRTSAQAFQQGNTLVVVGGASGPGGKPVGPEIFDLATGKARAL